MDDMVEEEVDKAWHLLSRSRIDQEKMKKGLKKAILRNEKFNGNDRRTLQKVRAFVKTHIASLT